MSNNAAKSLMKTLEGKMTKAVVNAARGEYVRENRYGFANSGLVKLSGNPGYFNGEDAGMRIGMDKTGIVGR
jgi:hypothetical protein